MKRFNAHNQTLNFYQVYVENFKKREFHSELKLLAVAKHEEGDSFLGSWFKAKIT